MSETTNKNGTVPPVRPSAFNMGAPREQRTKARIEESLFVEALEKPTDAQRQAFLDQACGDDGALKKRLERLIQAHLGTLGILDQPGGPLTWQEVTVGVARSASDDEWAGNLIAGRYRLVEELGTGGMGTVWRAEQLEPVRRIVAVKLIKAGMDSRTVLSRFEAERQALALMDHVNIAKVLDGGTTERGRPFFVMEHVEGVPITRYCDDARLSIDERLALFVPVCQAVQHAHTKGVIHRDLKPGNVLVGIHDGKPVPKVIDFGLAKAIDQNLAERTLETGQGVVIGTPLYMSPEQAQLNNADVDARADVYGLGVILYELLTGTTPFELQRVNGSGWQEFLTLVREEEPARPSARLGLNETLSDLAARRAVEPEKLTKLVRGELDWIVMKCLEKDRSRRYETPSALARDIERYLADQSVEACPPSVSYRLRKFLRRNRAGVLTAAAIFLLLIAGITGTTWGLVRANRARAAEAERALGERRANAKAQVRLRQIEKGSEILASVFADLDPRAEEREGRPLRLILGDRLDRAAALLDGESIGEELMVAELQFRLGCSYRALGHSAKAAALFNKAVAIRRRYLGLNCALTLAVMAQQASALAELGESGSAIALFEQVRDAQLRLFGPGTRDIVGTQRGLAIAYWKSGRWTDACALLEQVRDTLSKTQESDADEVIGVMDDLSAVYATVDKGAEALKLAQKVRDARVRKYGVDHYMSTLALNNLAARHQAVGQMRKALELFEEARDAIVPRLGPEHPASLSVLDNLARMYRAFGRTTEAVSLAEQVRDMRALTLGAYHPDTIYSTDNLGSAYQAAGEKEKAMAMFLRAAAGLEKLDFAHGAGDLIVWHVCDSLEHQEQFDRADFWREKWLNAVRRREGRDSVGYAQNLAKQGEYTMNNGRYANAELMLREAVKILGLKVPGRLSDSHARSLLGGALLAQKRFSEAEPLLIQGYEGVKACESEMSPLYAQYRVAECGQRVVKLYEDWGQSEKAVQWRAKTATAQRVKHKT